MSSRVTTITVTAEATIEAPAEMAIIRFKREGLYDSPTNKPTFLGDELIRQVLNAGADDIRTNPDTNQVSISVSGLSMLGSIVAVLRNAGTPKKPSTSYVVSPETRGLMTAAALTEAVEQARADIEPTVRALGGETVEVGEIVMLKSKVEAGTWPTITSNLLPTQVSVRARVTFEISGHGVIELDEETRDFYDNPPVYDEQPDTDPFGGEDFGNFAAPTTADTGELLARSTVGYTPSFSPLVDPHSVRLDAAPAREPIFGDV